MEQTLPFIIEACDGDEDPEQKRAPLPQGMSNPVHQTSRLSTLLGEELHHINAFRLCRSPAQGRGSSPSPQPFEELYPPNEDTGSGYRPSKLLLPTLPCVSPLNLSPR